MKAYHIFIFCLLLLIFSDIIIASPQLPDYIIFKNDTIPTYNLLLEIYLEKTNPEKNKLFGLSFRSTTDKFGMDFSVNCWRGYQAIYKIENDSLFLSGIIECHTIKSFDKKQSNDNLKLVFGDKVSNQKVFIDWFSGEISFPINKPNEIIRWDGFFENIFLYETVVSIKKGKIKQIYDVENYIDNPQRIDRIRKDTIQTIVFEAVEKFNWKQSDKVNCYEKYIVRINKKGIIDLVEMDLNENEIKSSQTRNEHSRCINSLKKALKDLKFDIIKRREKPIEERIYFDF